MMDFKFPPDAPNDGTPPGSELADGMDGGTAVFRLTRRNLIKGVIASSVSVAGMNYLFRNSVIGEARAAAPGAVERMLSLKVNGQVRHVDVLPNETLAVTLRDKLGLTGAKLGCDRGECGACSVMIDDVAHLSCTTLTHSVKDSKITTVEGVAAPDGTLHPVQQAFMDELAPQCGYCTPGQVISAVALLKANPHPTIDEVKLAMSGNLCRCGAYDYYTKGVLRAAGVS